MCYWLLNFVAFALFALCHCWRTGLQGSVRRVTWIHLEACHSVSVHANLSSVGSACCFRDTSLSLTLMRLDNGSASAPCLQVSSDVLRVSCRCLFVAAVLCLAAGQSRASRPGRGQGWWPGSFFTCRGDPWLCWMPGEILDLDLFHFCSGMIFQHLFRRSHVSSL